MKSILVRISFSISLKLVLLTILFGLDNVQIFAQWKAVYYEDYIDKIFYSLQNDKIKQSKFAYEFPTYYLDENNLSLGFDILNKNKIILGQFQELNIPRNEKLNYFLREFKTSIKCRKDSSIIFSRLFLKNVGLYKIYIHSSYNHKWYIKTIRSPFEGYQIPSISYLDEWKSDNSIDSTETQKLFYNTDGYQEIDKLLFVVPSQSEKFDFIANNIIIGNVKIIEKECIHPFFDKLFHKVGYSDTVLKSDCFLKSSYIPTILCTEEMYKLENCANSFVFKKGQSSDNEISLLKNLMYLIINEYPFYTERNLSKDFIKKKFDNFVSSYSDTSNIYFFTKQLSFFIKDNFNDGHFYLEPPSSKKANLDQKRPGPISLYEFGNKLLIAGIFDSIYKSKIELNDEILGIDNIPVRHIIDSLSDFQYGTYERRRRRAVSICLNRLKTDSCKLTLKNSDGVISTIELKYNREIIVPTNYRPVYYKFDILDNNIAYFRAGSMDGFMYLRFLNQFEKIVKAKGLIIDLRNNTGGPSSDGINLFSLFINRSTVYHNTIPSENSNDLESLVISPNSKHHFPESNKVIILSDENTACASEDFIQAMQQLENCSLLGTSRTCGALQNRYGISFPSGSFMSIDCLTPKIVGYNYGVIECKGVKPDIWVARNKVEDLAPYNDKLLKAALLILNN